jgi:transposase-like protein
MGKRKRRTFTAEFKADAVRLCKAGGQSIGAARWPRASI